MWAIVTKPNIENEDMLFETYACVQLSEIAAVNFQNIYLIFSLLELSIVMIINYLIILSQNYTWEYDILQYRSGNL